MKSAIFTFMPPCAPEDICSLHAAMVAKNAAGIEYVAKRGPNEGHWGHAAFIDACIRYRDDLDVVVFLEYDAVLMHSEVLPHLLECVATGALAGCSSCAMHLDWGRHAIAAPCCSAIPRQSWDKAGRPAALPNEKVDTMGRFTHAFQEVGIPVYISNPISCARPDWRMPDGTPFGPDTVYGIGVYHKFVLGSFDRLREELVKSLDDPAMPMQPLVEAYSK